MKESKEYSTQELIRVTRTTLIIANGILALALFHYTAWLIMALIRFWF